MPGGAGLVGLAKQYKYSFTFEVIIKKENP
jgi:hypothetical protein